MKQHWMSEQKYFLPHDAFIFTKTQFFEQFNALKILHAFNRNSNNKYDEPWEIEFHLTSKCNLHCTGCSYATRRTGKELTIKNIEDVIFGLDTKKIKSIFFSGGGDPFSWDNWDQLLKLRKRYFNDIPIGVASNFYEFENKVENPREINFYQVHIPGYDEQSCLHETGVKCFQQICSNLDHLFSKKSKKNYVAIKFILNNYNYHKISNFLDFISTYPADSVILKIQQNFLENEQTKIERNLISEKNCIIKHLIKEQYDIFIDNFEDETYLNNSLPKKCYIVEKGLYCLIRENGDVFPCIASTYDTQNSLGNIINTDIRAILNNGKKRKLNCDNMLLKKCPLKACRHYRFNRIINEYIQSPERFNLSEVPIPTLI